MKGFEETYVLKDDYEVLNHHFKMNLEWFLCVYGVMS